MTGYVENMPIKMENDWRRPFAPNDASREYSTACEWAMPIFLTKGQLFESYYELH